MFMHGERTTVLTDTDIAFYMHGAGKNVLRKYEFKPQGRLQHDAIQNLN
jgi:hypothetical protein